MEAGKKWQGERSFTQYKKEADLHEGDRVRAPTGILSQVVEQAEKTSQTLVTRDEEPVAAEVDRASRSETSAVKTGDDAQFPQHAPRSGALSVAAASSAQEGALKPRPNESDFMGFGRNGGLGEDYIPAQPGHRGYVTHSQHQLPSIAHC